MTRFKWTTVLAVFFSMAFLVSLEASARTETLRWNHPNPSDVEGYRVYYGTASRAYSGQVDVGIPPTDSQGAIVYDLEVDDAATVYVAVRAYSGDVVSEYSNEQVRSPSEDPGGTPQASAAIDHFVLWNAEADTVIDSDFSSGEQISLAEYGCTAIEVIGNDYLSSSGSPGSIRFDLDGQTPSTCSNAGPYAWEESLGVGQFSCATSLTGAGSHTLTVTPYDGNDCSGTEGTPVTLNFEVVDSGASGGTPTEPLGQPGRPTLILD